MRPTDRAEQVANDLLALETDLRAAFGFQPPAALVEAMDERFQRARALGPQGIGRRSRRVRRAVWLAAAALAILAIGGAGAVALQRFEDWSAPDFDVAWERGTVIHQAQTVGGYEVTVERAYADNGQVMVALAMEDLEKRAGILQLGGLNGTLVDEDGRDFPMSSGTSGPTDAHETLELWYFDPPSFPLAPGTREFTLTIDSIEFQDDSLVGVTPDPEATGVIEMPDPFHKVAGPWAFTFKLEVAAGAFVEPKDVSDTVDDVTVSVQSALLSPTRSMLDLVIEGEDLEGAYDPVEVTARRGSTTIQFGMNWESGFGSHMVAAFKGIDDAKGTWTITIGELVGPPLPGPQATSEVDGSFIEDSDRRRGPWVMTLVVP